MKKILVLFLFCFCSFCKELQAQQIPDSSYVPINLNRSNLDTSIKLTVYIDEAHNNFHTKDNRFFAFANVLRKNGFKVKSFTEKFSKESIKNVEVLVISNALNENARGPFVIPTQSAFIKKETEVVRDWVKNGGSLFLIADHMPFSGAAASLGKEFGFIFYDSFLFDEKGGGIIDFYKEKNQLSKHKVTKGIKKVRTFTGQAFKMPKKATSILNLREDYQVLLPDTMWVFNDKTKKLSAKKLSQGAILEFGKGKVAIFGEAAMFTAQLAGRNRFKVGMNSPEASENYKLLLNIISWLAEKKGP